MLACGWLGNCLLFALPTENFISLFLWRFYYGTRASYHAAKRIARCAVHHACQEADKEVYKNIDPKSSELYHLANQLRKENANIVGDKPVENDAEEMSMSDDSKQKAWLEHYQWLLNAEFDWDPNHLSDESPVEGPPIPITIDMVKKAISQMKAGKAPGPSGIVVEMIRVTGDMGASMIHDLAAAIIRDGKVPSDWEQSFIVCLYKGKGDALERGNYRGLKLTEQVMKVLERIVDGLIRQVVSIDDSQFGFVPGRGTTDAIFVIRQLQEKYLAANKRLYMAFVDLEKAFDQVPRKVIWWALRKLGMDEWIVRLVQGIYSNARNRVRVGEGYSEEFEAGLEKLTNANRSVSSVNDRLFPVELTEIADWKSMSEYMLHSNFGKALTGVIGGNFGANTFILPLPCFLNICLSFWMFNRRKEYLNKIKILRNFRE